MPARPGVPQSPREKAGRPWTPEGIDALLTRLERLITALERQEAADAVAIRLIRVRLHLLELRLAKLDTID